MKKIYITVMVLGCLSSGLYAGGDLHEAVVRKNHAMVKSLLEHGADVDELNCCGRRPLHCAVTIEDLDIVKLLLEHRASVNAVCSDGTPLHDVRRLDIASLLLEHGADVKAVDHYRRTPLHCALVGRHLDVARLLLEHEFNVKAVDRYGRTLLHCSLVGRYLDVAQLLLDKGADVNAVDGRGRTPLHYAAKNSHRASVAVLLARGADPTIHDQIDNRAVDDINGDRYPRLKRTLCDEITRRRVAGVWVLRGEHEREEVTETGERAEQPSLSRLPMELVEGILREADPDLDRQMKERQERRGRKRTREGEPTE